ncbi:OPT oligopeptide transporter protein-domain-containing protein [Kockovaella imperatae]|uniref:OPT oligopeptide transporter protein-domain-containing protein n=1 Tax=Kockovaella imperatae TaxID=4999 RepID=A0A1Y1UD89_9TREE|nr:OPT oligopeptide transporter protein-domain-containing protein [Kockovaella imperatae]ORX35494.1 OPT oligopeptide transporter protein-domain-containing protein [Kockovaella imperatae]
MEESGRSTLRSKSSLPLIPSTAGGRSDYTSSSFPSTAGGPRSLISRGSYGMTELTGDMTVPDGKTTWGDGMGGMPKDASEGGSMRGIDADMTEEDSPYPEVRASVSNIDDPEMPVLTFRVWVIGLFFTIVGVAANTFFNFRTPSPYIPPPVIQIVSYPCGKFLAYLLPIRSFELPLWLGGSTVSFNPGPFNIKEHTCICIMVNVGLGTTYALNVIVSTQLWYGRDLGDGFSVIFILITQLTGFAFAGLCRRFVIWPASMIWPTNLAIATNLNAFHAEDESFQGGMPRLRFLLIALGGAFVYYFLPGFLFTALSYFSFICWIAPKNKIVNELFGVSTGLGMSVLTFDWSQITWIGSPLVVPWWAQVNIGIGFVLLYWVLGPALYYSNTWFSAYIPLNVLSVADRYGAPFNVFNVLNSDLTLNVTAYSEYSPPYLSASYSVTFTAAFALSTAIVVHTILYHGPRIYRSVLNVRTEVEDIHMKLMRQYPEVPDWWYLALFLVCFALTVTGLEVFNTGMPVWGYILALLVPLFYTLPAAFIYAMTSQTIAINLVAELIPGYLFEGKPLPTMIFKCLSVGTVGETLNFLTGLKLGHYMKIPPRVTFSIQLVACGVSCLVQAGVKSLVIAKVGDLCGEKPTNLLSCASTKVFFTSSVIWGLIGPRRLFGPGAMYHAQTYAAIVGIFLPIPVYLWVRKRPQSFLRNFNAPVLLNACTYMPPATGINFASFLTVGFVFQFWLRRRFFAWWSKYNYVLAIAFDSGTALSALFIFICLDIPKARINWWGNTVYTETLDWQGNGASYLTAPEQGFGPTKW